MKKYYYSKREILKQLISADPQLYWGYTIEDRLTYLNGVINELNSK